MGYVIVVVSAATHRKHASPAVVVGYLAQAGSRMCVRGRAEFHVGDRIALDAVGAALQQDELGFVLAQVVFNQRPHLVERRIVGKGW